MSNIIDKIQLSGVTYDLPSGGSGSTTVELTQAEYDALVSGGTVDPDTFYIITDATPQDMSQYWTSAQTNSAITQAVSGKQDTLISGTNIKTINNESILGSGNITIQGGGGKAVTGGTNISVTTGETADTINCTLPIRTDGSYAGKGLILGNGNSMKSLGACSIVGGEMVSASTNAHYSVGFGNRINLSNEVEFSSGIYSKTNRASSTFGDSGNTLFSVGNGTADNARHNAFEIRQNGDIYLTKDGQDVKLQDQLGGSSITVDTALDSGSTNPVANSAITTALDAKQDTLVSGTNIKTINNQSILGSGNIDIQGSVTVDQTIISGSTNPVAGGAVYDALGDIETLLASI